MNAPSELWATKPFDLTRARIAVSTAFFVLGAGTGIWAVHIPTVQARLGLDPAILGFALFALAIGAVTAMPLTGWAISRVGSRLPTAATMLAFIVITPVPMLASSVTLFFAAMVLFGAAMGGLDVAMNTQASEIETARRRPTMSSFHGFFSLGGLAGAVIGAGMVAAGWDDGSGATAAAVVFLGFAALAANHLLPSARPIHSGPRFALPNPAVIGLGMLAFLCFALEGAVADWSALYLASVKLAGAAEAATGFALYSLAMAVFRLAGDPIVARLGARLTVALGGGLVALGMAVAILSPWPLVGAVGFGLVGVGAANIVPVVFSASARTQGVSPGMGVAAVATLGYAGFLVAPPVIGLIADAFGLSLGLWLVALAGLIVAAAGVLRRWAS